MNNLPTIVKCPTCQQPVEWSTAQPWRPFCSERCRLIDLGLWATESWRIEGDTEPAPADPDQACH